MPDDIARIAAGGHRMEGAEEFAEAFFADFPPAQAEVLRRAIQPDGSRRIPRAVIRRGCRGRAAGALVLDGRTPAVAAQPGGGAARARKLPT